MKSQSSWLRWTMVVLLGAAAISACTSEKPETLLVSAKDMIAKRQFGTAVIQAKSALQKMPNSAEGRYLLGRALLESGDIINAELELRKARDLKYAADEVVPPLLRATLLSGRPAKVVDEAVYVNTLAPKSRAEALSILASAYMAQGKRDDAKKAIADALAIQPDHVGAQLEQVRFLAAVGDSRGALSAVENLAHKHPNEFDVHALRGDLLIADARFSDAIEPLRAAAKLRPENIRVPALIAYGLLAQARFDSTSPKFQEALAEFLTLKTRAPLHPQVLALEAQLAFSKRDFSAAREAAQKLLRNVPDSPLVLQLAGVIEYYNRSFAQAESYLSKSLQAAPDVLATRRWLAQTYLATGRIAKATTIIEPALAKSQNDADMLYLAGEIYMQSGDFKRAEELFLRVTKLQPNDPLKQTALALARLGRGDGDSAFAELQQISASDKGTTADKALIASLLGRKEWGRAMQAILALDKKQPDNPVTLAQKGQVQVELKDIKGARSSFERALTINPAYLTAAAGIAGLDIADGKSDAAINRFESVLAADPKNAAAMVGLANLKVKLKKAPAAEIIALLNKAILASPTEAAPRIALINFYTNTKDVQKAVAAGLESIASIPDSPGLYDALGQAQLAAGEQSAALTAYNKLAALQPDLPDAYMRIAEVHAANGDPEAALQSLRKVLQIRPNMLAAQRAMLILEQQKGNQQEALAIARLVKKQRPDQIMGYALEGDVLAAGKAWRDAAEAYRAGLKREPSTEIAIKLHRVMLLDGKVPDADRFLAYWTKENPKDNIFRIYAGESLMVRRDFAGAAVYFRAALEISPDLPSVLNNLSFVASILKQPDALALAEKANKLAPGVPSYMDTLATQLADNGELARATELLAKASATDPTNLSIKMNYARALLRAGKKNEAKKQLDELVAFGDKFGEQKEVRKLLDGL